MYYFLDRYPIDEITSSIEKLQKQYWDILSPVYSKWNEASWPIELCLNDLISPFQHLSMDEGYDIFCYMAREFHGSIGTVAAIKRGEPHTAKCEDPIMLPKIVLPETSVDPMEIIYCDGTPEGYLEAVLYEKTLRGLSRCFNIYSDQDSILFAQPKCLDGTWDRLLNVDDWCPKVKDATLYFYMFEFEHGMEASNGRSRISLRCYSFSDHLDLRRVLGMPSRYPKQLPAKDRFHKGKHCCVFTKTTIDIAEGSGGRIG